MEESVSWVPKRAFRARTHVAEEVARVGNDLVRGLTLDAAAPSSAQPHHTGPERVTYWQTNPTPQESFSLSGS